MTSGCGVVRPPEPPTKKSNCQGNHGGCGANYRCCIPALAGFVSPHSVGPGKSPEKLKPGSSASKQNFSRPSLIYISRSLDDSAVADCESTRISGGGRLDLFRANQSHHTCVRS